MAITVKSITLWRREVDNASGVLASVLKPLAESGADLQVLMGYGYPGNESRAAIEIYPVAGKKSTAAAQAAGLGASEIPVLLVQGDNRPGLGYAMAQAVADAGINMAFVVAHALGRKYSAVFGFSNSADARKASTAIKKAAAGRKSPRSR